MTEQSPITVALQQAALVGASDIHIQGSGTITLRVGPSDVPQVKTSLPSQPVIDELISQLSDGERASLERGHPQDLRGEVTHGDTGIVERYRAAIFSNSFSKELTGVIRTLGLENPEELQLVRESVSESFIETADSEPISAAQLIEDLTEGVWELSEATGHPLSFAEIAREVFASEPDGYWTPTGGIVFTYPVGSGSSDVQLAAILRGNFKEGDQRG